MSSEELTLVKLVEMWVAEQGKSLAWQILPGHPHHLLVYQSRRPKGYFYIIIKDDYAESSASYYFPDGHPSQWRIEAADPDFFKKLEFHMREIECGKLMELKDAYKQDYYERFVGNEL